MNWMLIKMKVNVNDTKNVWLNRNTFNEYFYFFFVNIWCLNLWNNYLILISKKTKNISYLYRYKCICYI